MAQALSQNMKVLAPVGSLIPSFPRWGKVRTNRFAKFTVTIMARKPTQLMKPAMIVPSPPFPLIKQLAIPLSNHRTVAKWLVISRKARGTVRRCASFTLTIMANDMNILMEFAMPVSLSVVVADLSALQPRPTLYGCTPPSDGTTSQSTKLSKYDSQVAGYPVNGRGGQGFAVRGWF